MTEVSGGNRPTWETEPNSNLEKTLTLALSQRERELTEVLGADTPTWETEPNSNLEKNLTLALSQRERGLTEVSGGNRPTWETESNTNSEKLENRLPLPRERAGVRGCGSSHAATLKPKAKRSEPALQRDKAATPARAACSFL